MESAVFLLILAPGILILILKFDARQNRKINKVLKDTKNIQPLFLMRSVEQKMSELNTKLYGNIPINDSAHYDKQLSINEGARQLLAEQLNKLALEFNNKKITLKDYNIKLGQLTQTLEEIKFVNFEQVKSASSQKMFT